LAVEPRIAPLALPATDIPPEILTNSVTAAERARLCIDRVLALALLLAMGPLMLAIAWAVRRDGGPATFVQYRVGRRGRLFRCIKFRTMRVDAERVLSEVLERDVALRAEWEERRKLARDPRVTVLGRLLRESSLDELPQLINVLLGEMALVGPRPVTLDELRRYAGVRWLYLSVLPGITGLWQVSGRSETAYERRVELDRAYVKNRCFWLDCKILARTCVVVLTGQGAC
jgi:exopolysaccharide production protein ExoY